MTGWGNRRYQTLLGALRLAGIMPDSFLAEFGPQQYEVTVAPALGLRAADDAVITRELTQAVAFRFGHRACFAPLVDPAGVSNGTHIHWSFLDRNDEPVLYAADRPWQLSEQGAHFVAGICRASADVVRGDGTLDGVVLSPAAESLGAGAG